MYLHGGALNVKQSRVIPKFFSKHSVHFARDFDDKKVNLVTKIRLFGMPSYALNSFDVRMLEAINQMKKTPRQYK